MLKRSLVLKLFEGFSIERWNERIRPVSLIEMDKHAHKMIYAYCLGRCEEDAGNPVDWEQVITGGVCELLRRIVISDIKSPVFRKIREGHPRVFRKLNQWVHDQLAAGFQDQDFGCLFQACIVEETYLSEQSRLILDAANILSTFWEFRILKQADPKGYEIDKIDRRLRNDMERFLGLKGMRRIITRHPLADFLNLCGQMRFQIRWGQTPRIPSTSVLGHMLMVACVTFFLTRQLDSPCPRRLYNNFFGALFHDLPEAVTRDIISPVKRSVAEFEEVIKDIEREMVQDEIYSLLDPAWGKELSYFTRDEFSCKVVLENEVKVVDSEAINQEYNQDEFSPYDGEIVKMADLLAGFLEAYVSIKNGVSTPHLLKGIANRDAYAAREAGGVSLKSLYDDLA